MEDNKNLLRYPQAFTFDYTVLNRTFGEHAYLIRDILIFIAYKSIKLFFEEIAFDLDEFCEFFGYHKKELQRTLNMFVDCPEDELPIHGDHCFDSAFEYALYKALTSIIIFDRKRIQNLKVDLENLSLFIRIEAKYKKTGRLEKRTYTVELDYRIRQWQLDGFFLADIQLYRDIRVPKSISFTSGLRNFYLYLGRIVSQIKWKMKNGEEPSFTLSVDEASKIMGINLVANYKRKMKVIVYLEKIKEFIGNNHFYYVFFKDIGQRYKYSIKISLSKETIDYYDDKERSVFFHNLNKDSNIQYFSRNISKPSNWLNWKRSISEEEQNKMDNWLFDKNCKSYPKAKQYFAEVFQDLFLISYDGRHGKL